MDTQALRVGSEFVAVRSVSVLPTATVVVFAAALVFGGGTQQALATDALIQLLSLVLIGLTVPGLFREGAERSRRLIFGVMILVLCVAFYELLPLPAAIWLALPGRGPIADAYNVAGIGLPWLPITLQPEATWRCLLSLLPGVAIFAAVTQLNLQTRRGLSLLLVAIGLVSVLLGLAQLMEGPSSGLRFFPVTNADSSVGFFANRNHYAALLYCLIPFVTAWTAEFLADRGSGRILGTAIFLGIYIVLLLGLGMALSRAGIVLALIASMSSLLMFLRLKSDVTRKNITIMMAATVAGALLIVQFALFNLIARFGTDTLADSRFDIAKTTSAAALAFAPIGSGLGSFQPIYKMFEGAATVGHTFVYHAHDDWLELWLELGWLAPVLAIGFLIWFGRAAFSAWRAPQVTEDVLDRCLPLAASIVLALLLLHSIVDYPLRTTALDAVLAFACALMIPPAATRRRSSEPRPVSASEGDRPSTRAHRSDSRRRARRYQVGPGTAADDAASLAGPAAAGERPTGARSIAR